MDIFEIRKANLKKLQAKSGMKKGEFAVYCGSSPASFSQIFGGKAMGSKLARRVEAALDLPAGYIDNTHTNDNNSPESFLYQVNTKVLQKVIFELEIAMLESGISLTPGDKAELIAEFYREAIEQEWTTTSQWQEKVAHFLQAV